jgi:hypothetical protein
MTRLGRAYRGEVALPADTDIPHLYRRVLGLSFIIKSIYRVSALPEFDQITSKLAAFHGPDIILTEANPRTPEKDTVWELIIALLSRPFAEHVRFEEPDVRLTLNATNWGTACKVLYTDSRDNQIDRIVVGAKQLERSSASLGCVAVNVSNLIDHSKYFPRMPGTIDEFGSFRDFNMPLDLLRQDLGAVVLNLDKRSFITRLTQDLNTGLDRMKTRAVIFLVQTVASVTAIPMLLTMCDWYVFRRVVGVESTYFVELNHFGQTTMSEVVVCL